jgi:type IV pilus assembly protein PilC
VKSEPASDDVIVGDEPIEVVTPAPKTGGFFTLSPVRRDEIIAFLRQLIMLQEAGTPLLRSLETLGQRGERSGIRALVTDIAQYVESGNALWQAFERHPRHFDTVFVNLVKASEASGTLVTVLRRQVEYWERRELLGKQLRRAMYYPVILVVTCALVLLLFAHYVIPEFENMFETIGAPVGTFTEGFISTVKMVGNPLFMLLCLAVVVGLFVLYRIWVSNRLVRLRMDRLKLRIPKIGPGILQKYAVVEMTRSLSLLLRSGLSMMVTLDLVRNAIHNQAVANVLQSVRDSVERGEGIEEPLRRVPGIVPPVVTDMLVTGEEAGQLDEIAEHVAETYEQEVQIALAGLGDMIQPILTVFIGGFVLLAALALFVPIISMIGQISAAGM